MKSSFRRALLSGALLILPVGPAIAAIDPDPNVRNAGNEKYLASLMRERAFCAAPCSANIPLSLAC